MDKDGFGDHNQEIRVSACPSGYVDNNLDCNDQDGLINPEAHKLCDEKDNDCDGLIDDEGSLIAGVFYVYTRPGVGYQRTETLETGKGYWILLNDTADRTIINIR